MERIYLAECCSCLSIMPMRKVNCPHCGAFQLRLNWDFFDMKMDAFEKLAEFRLITEDRIEYMKEENLSNEQIKQERAIRDATREAMCKHLMDQIEENESFLLN